MSFVRVPKNTPPQRKATGRGEEGKKKIVFGKHPVSISLPGFHDAESRPENFAGRIRVIARSAIWN